MSVASTPGVFHQPVVPHPRGSVHRTARSPCPRPRRPYSRSASRRCSASLRRPSRSALRPWCDPTSRVHDRGHRSDPRPSEPRSIGRNHDRSRRPIHAGCRGCDPRSDASRCCIRCPAAIAGAVARLIAPAGVVCSSKSSDSRQASRRRRYSSSSSSAAARAPAVPPHAIWLVHGQPLFRSARAGARPAAFAPREGPAGVRLQR